jgi:phosphopantetheinyl transferase (holo-ACP synthase)
MHDDGVRLFVEVGPRNNLTAFVDDTLRGQPHLAIASNLPRGSALTQLNHLLGLLAAHGVTMRLECLYERRAPRRLPLAAGAAAPAPAPSGSSGMMRLAMGLQPLRLSAEAVAAGQRRPPAPPASPPAAARVDHDDPRPQVMKEYLETMDRFLTVQQQVVGSLLHNGTGHAAKPSPPLLGQLVSLTPGRELVARCDLDLGEHLFLRDHTLESGRISVTDPRLIGLPVMPLTLSMEILAEAAALLAPGRVVVGMRDVRAHRWIGVDEQRLALRVVAVADGHVGEMHTRIEAAADPADGREVPAAPLVEATVVLGDGYPDQDVAETFPLWDEGESSWAPGTLYGGHGLFHGPSFQVVQSIDRTGRDGTEATLIGLPARRLLRSDADPGFLVDPVTLDGLGQVVAYWVGDHFQAGRNIFPIRLERLELFGRGLASGDRATCRVRVTAVDGQSVRSDIEVVAPGRRLLARMTGWEDRRLELPPSLVDFLAAPEEVLVAAEWPAPLERAPSRESLAACLLRRRFDDVLEAYGMIWLRVLAYTVLGQRERAQWRELESASPRRRIEWLTGRIAAKDAVRLLLRERVGRRCCPADIEIVPDDHGRPQVRGVLAAADGSLPSLSIAHTPTVAAAVAGLDGGSRSIGVDVELIDRMVEEVERAAFGPHEQALLSSMGPPARQEWSTRLWCAKEAVAKAVGRGMVGGPLTLEARDFDPVTGEVTVRLGPELAALAPDVPTGTLVAGTVREDDLVVACSVLDHASGGPAKEW